MTIVVVNDKIHFFNFSFNYSLIHYNLSENQNPQKFMVIQKEQAESAFKHYQCRLISAYLRILFLLSLGKSILRNICYFHRKSVILGLNSLVQLSLREWEVLLIRFLTLGLSGLYSSEFPLGLKYHHSSRRQALTQEPLVAWVLVPLVYFVANQA